MTNHDEREGSQPTEEPTREKPAADHPEGKRPLGLYKGQIWMSEDFDDPLPWQIFPGFPLEPTEDE